MKVTPFLMFNKGVKDAFEYYHSVFKNSEILSMTDMGGMHSGEIVIEGQKIIGFDGGESFQFSEGFSLMIHCKDQEEIDLYWGKLTSNGGEESMCGWVKDKWGLSWQIVPENLSALLSEPSGRAMQAMLHMKKLDIKKLEDAARLH